MKELEKTGLFATGEDRKLGPGWIQAEQVKWLYTYGPLNFITAVITATVLTVLMWSVSRPAVIVGWLASIVLVSAARFYLNLMFKKAEPEAESMPGWGTRYIVGVLVAGLVWGSAGGFLFPPDSLQHQIFIAFALAGVCASTVSVLAALRLGFLLFAMPAMLPLLYRLVLQGDYNSFALALLILLFLLGLTVAARQTHQAIENVLKLQLENLELARELQYEATHDSLMGLVNQREFKRRFERMSANARVHSSPYALVFLDLDYFKQINDTAGHMAGDKLLREIGRLMKTKVRGRDTLARIGGDEFALLLEGCGRDQAVRIAEMLHRTINTFKLEYEGKLYGVGVSIGITFTTDGSDSASAMLKAADKACYASKEAGRNRIEVLHPDPSFEMTGRFRLSEL
ncbi:MAG: GGDEF domain-containing protein [Gammaproteobacteria bacterium]|nr:GGDEF domain-containing protein [Gammaproteobacteria bacterium]